MRKNSKLFVIAIILSIIINRKILEKEIDKRVEIKELSDKHLTLLLLLNQWLKVTREGKSVVEYFHKNNIKNVAIYGMSYIGERLYDELIQSDIEIRYVVDRDNTKRYGGVEVIHSYDEMREVDAVVITPVFYYDNIKGKICEKVKGEILSLQDILYEL